MSPIIAAIIFGIMVYLYWELHRARAQRIRVLEVERIIKQREEKQREEQRSKSITQQIRDLQQAFSTQEEINYLEDIQTKANLKALEDNSLVEQALILQRRGRPEQGDHIVDQVHRQSHSKPTVISQSNIVNYTKGEVARAQEIDASNPRLGSVQPIINITD